MEYGGPLHRVTSRRQILENGIKPCLDLLPLLRSLFFPECPRRLHAIQAPRVLQTQANTDALVKSSTEVLDFKPQTFPQILFSNKDAFRWWKQVLTQAFVKAEWSSVNFQKAGDTCVKAP